MDTLEQLRHAQHLGPVSALLKIVGIDTPTRLCADYKLQAITQVLDQFPVPSYKVNTTYNPHTAALVCASWHALQTPTRSLPPEVRRQHTHIRWRLTDKLSQHHPAWFLKNSAFTTRQGKRASQRVCDDHRDAIRRDAEELLALHLSCALNPKGAHYPPQPDNITPLSPEDHTRNIFNRTQGVLQEIQALKGKDPEGCKFITRSTPTKQIERVLIVAKQPALVLGFTPLRNGGKAHRIACRVPGFARRYELAPTWGESTPSRRNAGAGGQWAEPTTTRGTYAVARTILYTLCEFDTPDHRATFQQALYADRTHGDRYTRTVHRGGEVSSLAKNAPPPNVEIKILTEITN